TLFRSAESLLEVLARELEYLARGVERHRRRARDAGQDAGLAGDLAAAQERDDGLDAVVCSQPSRLTGDDQVHGVRLVAFPEKRGALRKREGLEPGGDLAEVLGRKSREQRDSF